MDDLKFKLMGLIQKQGHTKIPVVGTALENELEDEDEDEEGGNKAPKEPERPSDQEILESIHENYFIVNEPFDPSRFELDNIVSSMTVKRIEENLKRLKQQHVVVSNQVLQMILEKQSACQEECNRIEEIRKCVTEALTTVRSGRSNLNNATRHFTTASLGILANYRKRTLVLQLLKSLKTLRTLQRTEAKLQKLFTAGDFPGAIALLLECLKEAASYRQFSCVTSLQAKLQDTLVMAEQHLEDALAKICYEFDEETYKKLQSAYFLLDKTQIAVDQLNMHFTSTVHNSAFNVVLAHADHDPQSGAKKQYVDLCKFVLDDKLIPCLLDLCKAMWCIVLSYYSIVAWHQANSPKKRGDFELSYNEQYVKQKLESGLTRLWHDVQTKVSSLVLSANLKRFKIDEFLQVLGILHRLSQIGEELCGSTSEEVADSIKKQSSNYFKIYHAARLEELKVFLEYESWTLCPVRTDFTLLHLQEFRGLRCSVEQCAGVTSTHNTSLDSSSVGGGYFTLYPDPTKATPFDSPHHLDNRNENILDSTQDALSEEFSEESEEEASHDLKKGLRNHKKYKDAPLLNNTILTVLRHCGKYLQMSRLLKSIAAEVVGALCQLFEYYLYTVYSLFTADAPPVLCSQMTTIKLRAVLWKIKDTLIFSDESAESSPEALRVHEAQMSPDVDATNPSSLYGLSERVIAVESLIFLSQQYNLLRPYLEQLLQSQGSTTHPLSLFYAQTVNVCSDVRKPVYACVAWDSIDSKQILTMMSKADWEVEEVASQHSSYVDSLIKEIEAFRKRLEDFKVNGLRSMPEQVSKTLWEIMAERLAHIFVEGFASTKKCSTAGRALMQLDYTQLLSHFEKVTQLRPAPCREFVEVYIKAYYSTEAELEALIRDHSEYSLKQLQALVGCIFANNKKARQKLTVLIDECRRPGVR